MSKHNSLKEKVAEIMDSQIAENNPPETRLTLERLIVMGYEENEARHMIVKCLIVEITDAMYQNKFFNEKRYIKNLLHLPNIPDDTENNPAFKE